MSWAVLALLANTSKVDSDDKNSNFNVKIHVFLFLWDVCLRLYIISRKPWLNEEKSGKVRLLH